MKRIEVVMVTENLMEGGAQFFILRLAKALREADVSVSILLLNDDHENRLVTQDFTDLPIIRLHTRMRWLLRFLDKCLFQLRFDFSLINFFHVRYIRLQLAGKTDLFHTHYIKTDYLISQVKKKDAKIGHVASVHGDYLHQYRHCQQHGRAIWNSMEPKFRQLAKMVDKWALASDEQRDFFVNTLQFPADRMEKIYYGFAKPSPAVKPIVRQHPEEFIIGMAARGIKEKGWQVLIDAFLQLPNNCRLLLAGKGAFLTALEKQYASEKRIVFAGYQENMMAFINQCDVMVLPSVTQTESLPYVVIESLSCGKPVIATDIGEVRKMLTVEQGGELAGEVLTLRNGEVKIEELHQALLRFANDKENLVRKSRFALEAFKKFEMNRCVDAYLKLYQQAMKEKQ